MVCISFLLALFLCCGQDRLSVFGIRIGIMAGLDDDAGQSKSWMSRVSGEIHKVPCMRTAFLYGIGGGFSIGLVTFLFTSRVKRSTDIGILSFVAVTLSSFTYCRYNRAKMTIQQRRFRELQGIEPREVSHQFKSER